MHALSLWVMVVRRCIRSTVLHVVVMTSALMVVRNLRMQLPSLEVVVSDVIVVPLLHDTGLC